MKQVKPFYSAVLIILILAFSMESCSSGKSSQEEASQSQPVDNNNDNEGNNADPNNNAGNKDDFAATLEEYSQLLALDADECKQNTKLMAPQYKLHTGYDAGSNSYPNITAAGITCETSNIEKLIELEGKLFDLDQEKAIDALNELFSGLDIFEHFVAESKKITVTLSEGLVQSSFEQDSDEEGNEFPGKILIFTSSAAGNQSITFSYGAEQISVDVLVAEYTADQINAGRNRYENASADSPACASCHVGDNGVDHSANRIGVCSDAEIAGAITSGTYAQDAADADAICGGYKLNVNHSWQFASDEERDAVVAFLRTLPLDKPTRDGLFQQ